MARDRKDLGARKFVRVDLRKRGFLNSRAGCALDRVLHPRHFRQRRLPRCRRPRGAEDVRPFADRGRRGAAGMHADLAQGRVGRRPVHLRPGTAEGRRAGRRPGGFQKGARLTSARFNRYPRRLCSLCDCRRLLRSEIWTKRWNQPGYFGSAFFSSRSIRSWTRRIASRLSLASVLPGDDLVADAELPFPNARSDRRHGEFDALVDHTKIPPRPQRFIQPHT